MIPAIPGMTVLLEPGPHEFCAVMIILVQKPGSIEQSICLRTRACGFCGNWHRAVQESS